MTTVLKIDNLKKVYSSGKEALKGINLEIKKGDFVGLLGPNGAGKSTTINIMADVVTKSSGSINLSGYDFDKNRIQFKRSIGIVPQEISLDVFFSPLEVLMLQQGYYGKKPSKETAIKLLQELGLEDKKNVYVRMLSGGMKRRLLVAKAMVHNPDVIILDEPTAGVDVELRQNLWDYLIKLNKDEGKTIILTTHYLEEAQALCNKIAIINHGELIAYEDKDALINKVGHKEVTITVKDSIDSNLNQKLKEFKLKVENNVIKSFYKKDSELGEIINKISSLGLKIDTIDIQESSLEKVFLELTKSK